MNGERAAASDPDADGGTFHFAIGSGGRVPVARGAVWITERSAYAAWDDVGWHGEAMRWSGPDPGRAHP